MGTQVYIGYPPLIAKLEQLDCTVKVRCDSCHCTCFRVEMCNGIVFGFSAHFEWEWECMFDEDSDEKSEVMDELLSHARQLGDGTLDEDTVLQIVEKAYDKSIIKTKSANKR